MKSELIKSDRIGDEYHKIVHPSGLTIYIYPKKGFCSTYAIFGTNYGSIHTTFRTGKDKEFIEVPAGIAHYLEHKLFESEDGDAFARYAKTGASANAYTSFHSTCYLFSCTKNFEDSLKILLDFVQSPYFTEQTVQKEQGIIGQEIKMYDDDPEWKVMFNLLGAMYHRHPVKIDIAGSIESISKITADTLYQCYESFYNLNNMALCIAGNVDPDNVLSLIDEGLKQSTPTWVESSFPDEPKEVVKKRVEQQFAIAVPMFELGFKETADSRPSVKELAQTDILLELFASKSSPLYQTLLEKKLINASSFSFQYFEGPGYASVIFSGESRNPDEAAKLIRDAADQLHRDGIDQKAFENAKKAVYGKTLSSFNSADNIANLLIDFAFSGRELFSYIDEIAEATPSGVLNRLKKQLLSSYSSLSVVTPMKNKEV